jgi:hypothetical protein
LPKNPSDRANSACAAARSSSASRGNTLSIGGSIRAAREQTTRWLRA